MRKDRHDEANNLFAQLQTRLKRIWTLTLVVCNR
jgi:hypothetical protein